MNYLLNESRMWLRAKALEVESEGLWGSSAAPCGLKVSGSDRREVFSATGQASRAASAPPVSAGAVAHRAAPATAARGGWGPRAHGYRSGDLPASDSSCRSRLPASPQSLAMSCYIYQLPSHRCWTTCAATWTR